jgi:hypothetical protein
MLQSEIYSDRAANQKTKAPIAISVLRSMAAFALIALAGHRSFSLSGYSKIARWQPQGIN